MENNILKESADIQGYEVGFDYKNFERNLHRGRNVGIGSEKCNINMCCLLKTEQ